VFNAHRIFAPSTIISALEALELVSFSAVNDRGEFLENLDPDASASFEYGCGLFEFTK
jgi:hypothetical protein